MSDTISKTDPRHDAAQAVIDSMHEYFNLDPFSGAVRWIEDSDGRVIIFTRGEYKEKIRDMLTEESFATPEKQFEAYNLEQEGE